MLETIGPAPASPSESHSAEELEEKAEADFFMGSEENARPSQSLRVSVDPKLPKLKQLRFCEQVEVKTPDGATVKLSVETPDSSSVDTDRNTTDSVESTDRPAPKLTVEEETQKAEDLYFSNLYKSNESDEDFYRRIWQDWDLQDRLGEQPASLVSRLLYYPVLWTLGSLQWIINQVLGFIDPSYRRRNKSRAAQNFEQKKQAGLVFAFLLLLPLTSVAYGLAVFFVLFPLTTLPTLAYLIFIFYDKSPENGSRVAFLRYWSMWRHFVSYFPIRLVKTANLDPNDKFVFCYHPHGIISFGAFGNFATDATGFSRKFPGINLRLLTLGMNFFVPWLREFLLSMGVCSCSKKSCNQNLQRGPGSAIMLVVGGAEESLLAAPGTYRLNVNGRKGFVRVAIDNGAHLVPVLGFGENDAFTTHMFEKGSFIRTVQDEFKKRFGFATPVFWGTDTTNGEAFGVMPHRTPIIVVVGKPLECPNVPAHLKGDKLRTTAEGREIVNKFHERYIKALKALYDAFKNKWAINRSESMRLVGNPGAIHVPRKT